MILKMCGERPQPGLATPVSEKAEFGDDVAEPGAGALATSRSKRRVDDGIGLGEDHPQDAVTLGPVPEPEPAMMAIAVPSEVERRAVDPRPNRGHRLQCFSSSCDSGSVDEDLFTLDHEVQEPELRVGDDIPEEQANVEMDVVAVPSSGIDELPGGGERSVSGVFGSAITLRPPVPNDPIAESIDELSVVRVPEQLLKAKPRALPFEKGPELDGLWASQQHGELTNGISSHPSERRPPAHPLPGTAVVAEASVDASEPGCHGRRAGRRHERPS